jgi:hypothetical protein
MAISINPVLPVLSAQEAGGIAPELVLQPGSVVSAQVLKVLSADLVRIAIASLSIDVATEIPLQQGQNLQLAVVQTKDGIRLAMVGRGGDAAGSSADAVTLSSDALADAALNRPAILSPKSVLTPLERTAVSAAAQAAVTEQDSLAPLFANLGAAVSSSNLPPKRSRRCWRNRPASTKALTVPASRRRSRNPESSSRRRWRQVPSPRAAFPISRPR